MEQRVFSDSHMQRIAKAGRFTRQDLERNRRRCLSDAQIKRLDRWIVQRLWINSGVLIVLVLICGIAGFAGAFFQGDLVSAVIVAAIMICPIPVLIQHARQVDKELSADRAELPDHRIQAADGYPAELVLGRRVRAVLQPDRVYRVYFTWGEFWNTGCKRLVILSIEPYHALLPPIERMTVWQLEYERTHGKSKGEKRKGKPKPKHDRFRVG